MTKDRLCKLSEHLGSKIMTSEQGEKKGERERGGEEKKKKAEEQGGREE